MERDRFGKIQSHLDLRAVQERSDARADIHLGAVSDPEPRVRQRKPTLLRLQELLREIMRSSGPVTEIKPVAAPSKSTAPSPAVVSEERQAVIYVDSSGLASQKNS